MNSENRVPFDKVLFGELELIAERRDGNDAKPSRDKPAYEQARAMNLAALAFSGGGIRSAVFNLGFIQGLANKQSLHLFDYLSTVSGGGYIGGWLSALLDRRFGRGAGEREVLEKQGMLATPPDLCPDLNMARPEAPECRPVRFLRRYANYLTPKVGVSGDTLALISIMVRNITVMQMLLISLLVAAFSGMLVLARLVWLPRPMPAWEGMNPFAQYGLMGFGLIMLIAALFLAHTTQRVNHDDRYTRFPNAVVFIALLLAMSAGVLIALNIQILAALQHKQPPAWWASALLFAGYGFAWRNSLLRDKSWLKYQSLLGVAGGGGILVLSLYLALGKLPEVLAYAPFGHVVAFAPLVTLLVCSLVITLHLALAGPHLLEQTREWWARLGGQGNALGLLWALAYAFLLYVPPLIQFGAEWSVAGGGVWAAATWIGARLARGGDTGGEHASVWKEALSRLTPWAFLLGLLGLVAWVFVVGMTGGMPTVTNEISLPDRLLHTIAVHQTALTQIDLLRAASIGGASLVLFLVLVKSVDLNLFSAHAFYTNRLARAFLGASREQRKPNRYTGFDPKDDIKLSDLAGQRPIHIVNANLNLDGGKELAWQTRRGASFVFTPMYCGYSTHTSIGDPIGCYRPTGEYAGGKLTLATAVAVSGAAASPNMGFHTSPAVSALLTAFNLRLARWCPNPDKAHWNRSAPVVSVGPLFSELTGEADSASKWVNISDGGHFENLGLYELIRRRVNLIVVTDVGEDGKYQFDDLAMAVRKVWVDLGVRIDIRPEALDDIRLQPARDGAPRFSGQSWALGRICYSEGEHGYLVYVKSSLTARAPVDIRQYRDAHPAFPHEPTADQWFDEDQFETYRHLGQIVAEEVWEQLLASRGSAAARVEEIRARIKAMLDALENAGRT